MIDSRFKMIYLPVLLEIEPQTWLERQQDGHKKRKNKKRKLFHWMPLADERCSELLAAVPSRTWRRQRQQ